MKALICELCGSQDLVKQDGMFVCQHCGTKYSVEEAKKMMSADTVDVSGSVVKVDTSDKLKNLYQVARRAKDDKNSENAAKYYDMIMVEDPTSWEAAFYSVIYKAANCKIADIYSSAKSISNCEKTVLSLIRDYVADENEQIHALNEVFEACKKHGAVLFDAEVNFWKQHITTVEIQEMLNICVSAVDIMLLLGNNIEEVFSAKKFDSNVNSIIVKSWKEGLRWFGLISANVKPEDVQNTVNKFTEKIRKYESDYEKVELKSGKSGGCYVATAVYGSYDCPEVWTLRRFRDYTLAETWYGRAFIHTYYAISPTLVKWFGNTNWFKNMWRGTLDKMVNSLNNKGVEDTPYEDRVW